MRAALLASLQKAPRVTCSLMRTLWVLSPCELRQKKPRCDCRGGSAGGRMDKGKMERLGTPWVRGVCSPGHVTEYSQNMAEKPASVEVYCFTGNRFDS